MAETLGDSANDTGIGALLRASRMRIGEDLHDIASMLRIRYPYLNAIEEGRFDELPGQPYAVGFVRAYADHLGLDGEEVVRRFKEEFEGGSKTKTELSFPTPIAEANMPGGAIVFIGLLMAVLAYGFWYVSTSDENYLVGLIEPIPDRLASFVSGEKVSVSVKLQSAEVPEVKSQKQEMSENVSTGTKPNSDEEQQESDASQPVEAVQIGSDDAENLEKTPAVIDPSSPKQDESIGVNPEKSIDLSPDKKLPTAESGAPVMAETPATKLAPSSPETAAASSATVKLNKNPEPVPLSFATETMQGPTVAVATAIKRASDKPLPTLSPTARAVEIEETARAADLGPKPEPSNLSEAPKSVTPQSKLSAGPSAVKQRQLGSIILLRAKTECWIQVQDDKGNVLFADLLKTGDEYQVPNKTGLRLETGNAGALDILVDGEPVPAIGDEGVVRQDVPLDPALLKTGKAASQ